MSDERDELAKLLFLADNDAAPDPYHEWEMTSRHNPPGAKYVYEMADSILRAGYTKPRTITTAEELDALPERSVVMGADGYVARRFPGGWRVLVVEPASSPWLTDTLEDVDLPATVLHEPEAAK